jgi:hypothetical protein
MSEGGGGDDLADALGKLFITEGTTIEYQGSKQSQALRMATNSKPDEPMGTASIASCLALLLALISKDAVKAKLLGFLGFRNSQELLSLKDKHRVLNVLLSTDAAKALNPERCEETKVCNHFWNQLDAKRILQNEGEVLENQLNDIIKKALEIEEDMFEPYQIVPEDQVRNLIAALLSFEKIEVKWKHRLDKYMMKNFRTSEGKDVLAPFCVNNEAREMNYLHFEGGTAVLLPCKDEENGKKRGMIFVLPPESAPDLNHCLQQLAKHADNQGLDFEYSQEYDFSFPAFDVSKKADSIKEWLETYVPEIFKEEETCMDKTLPQDMVGGLAYVGDVHHGASIKADREGVAAVAYTALTAIRYVSISCTAEFDCNRPFISILATFEPGTTKVDNIEFVTKHETETMIDKTKKMEVVDWTGEPGSSDGYNEARPSYGGLSGSSSPRSRNHTKGFEGVLESTTFREQLEALNRDFAQDESFRDLSKEEDKPLSHRNLAQEETESPVYTGIGP